MSILSPRHFVVALALAAPTVLRAQAAPTTPPPSPTPVTFFGELRSRSEWDRPGGAIADDEFTYLRTRFGARVGAAPGARILVELQDSRVLGGQGTTSGADIFDVHQAYLQLDGTRRGTAAALRIGRQEIAFGNERLVGAVNWSNTGRTFDGAAVTLTPHAAPTGGTHWSATGFVATVEERGRKFGGSATPSSDHTAAGAFVTRATPVGAFDATALYDVGTRYRAYADADRVTLDARLHDARVGLLRFDVEGALQTGTQSYQPASDAARSQDVRAWLAAARVATAPMGTRRTVATVGLDVLSGDTTPTNGRYAAFNTMFATNHPFYGLMDLFADPAARTLDRGLVDAFASGTTTLSKTVALRADVHRFATQAGDAGIIGWESDVLVPWKLTPASSVELGYSLFRASTGAQPLGLGADGAYRNWAYLQLRVGF